MIPAYNEEEGIHKTINDVKNVLEKLSKSYEIIVIDDGSTDSTSTKAEQEEIIVIKHPYNLGYGAALKTGFRNAKGDSIVFLDADGTYPPEAIPQLLEHLNNFDLVIGARKGYRVKMPLVRKIGNKFFAFLSSYIAGKKIQDPASGMRAIHQNVIENFMTLTDGFSFTTTMSVKAIKIGLRMLEIPINYYDRFGKSKLNPLRTGSNNIGLLLRLAMDYNPLKIFLPMSTILISAGLILSIYNIYFFANLTDSSVILFLSGLQILLLGLLADLITRKIEESK